MDLTRHSIVERLYETARVSVLRLVGPEGPLVAKMCRQQRAVGQLRVEYEMLRTLQNDHIVECTGWGSFKGEPALLLNDCEAAALSGRSLTVPEVLEVGIGVARALEYLQTQRVVHRDVNPANILYDSERGIVRLTDFGIATRLHSQVGFSAAEAIEGTLAYIAPEQTGRLNRNVDHRADLYSLGATLYTLLTGNPPFGTAADALALVHSHLTVPPEILRWRIPRSHRSSLQ